MPERRDWPLRWPWVDLAWAVFAAANLVAMLLFGDWETVPFHFIWVSLTLLYGFRVWRAAPTAITLGCVIVATGAAILIDVAHGTQPIDEVTEVPLMSAMFVAMVWHARRRLAATDEAERVSKANLELLERQRHFVQDASHELRTPITAALGHVQLIERLAGDSELRDDAHVAVEELLRLRSLADRLLTLAALEEADPLHVTDADVDVLLGDALRRWGAVRRTWVGGPFEAGRALVDPERVIVALDALIENSVKHTSPDDRIQVEGRRSNGSVVLAVSDSGPGVPAESTERIFDRFARADASRSRGAGGVGLGLAIVKAVADAHGGSVRLDGSGAPGSRFELTLPVGGPPAAAAGSSGSEGAR